MEQVAVDVPTLISMRITRVVRHLRGPGGQDRGLRFSGERARWVADEVWHPEQRGK